MSSSSSHDIPEDDGRRCQPSLSGEAVEQERDLITDLNPLIQTSTSAPVESPSIMALPKDMQDALDEVMNRVEPFTEEEMQQLKEIDTAIKEDQKEEWKYLMTNMITQMMFVSGETAEPSMETTTIIEEIVREQVVEMVSCESITVLNFLPHSHRYPSLHATYQTLSLYQSRKPNPFLP